MVGRPEVTGCPQVVDLHRRYPQRRKLQHRGRKANVGIDQDLGRIAPKLREGGAEIAGYVMELVTLPADFIGKPVGMAAQMIGADMKAATVQMAEPSPAQFPVGMAVDDVRNEGDPDASVACSLGVWQWRRVTQPHDVGDHFAVERLEVAVIFALVGQNCRTDGADQFLGERQFVPVREAEPLAQIGKPLRIVGTALCDFLFIVVAVAKRQKTPEPLRLEVIRIDREKTVERLGGLVIVVPKDQGGAAAQQMCGRRIRAAGNTIARRFAVDPRDRHVGRPR